MWSTKQHHSYEIYTEKPGDLLSQGNFVHENCPYASEAKDLVAGPSSLCISMCALIYMVIVSVACSTGTCYKNTGKHLLHSTAIYLSQQLPWSGLTNGPQGGRKEL